MGTGRDGGGFSCIYSSEGIIAPRRSSINLAAMRAVTPAEAMMLAPWATSRSASLSW
jgi:hypothetical protein